MLQLAPWIPERPVLLDVDSLSRAEAELLLSNAEVELRQQQSGPRLETPLAGRTVLQLFFEASTRTRSSFEMAAKRLGAEVVNLNIASSSVSKGETLTDTVRTLEAMRPDVLVVRHPSSGAAAFVSSKIDCGVVNAGDGLHAHPTQALLDALTIRMRKGCVEGLKVTICGDVMHSRVARSGAILLKRLGADVHFVGPRTLIPREFAEAFGVTTHTAIEEALRGADVVMCLRIQRERLSEALLPSLREYSRTYGLDAQRLGLAAADAMVMHPGPMNRGVEIAHDVADGPQSSVLDQVEAGVAVRSVVLRGLVAALSA